MRVLSTVLKPSSGNVTVAGYDVAKEPQKVRAHIGFISNNTGIYEKLTPLEMVSYFGSLYGMNAEQIKQRNQEVFSLLEMNDFVHTINSKLSSGMRQKVSLARTIIHDPPVLIFDEPTVSLDILIAKAVVDFIHLCRNQGKCIILSTHIMSEAEKLCDRIAIIHNGTILCCGTLEELKKKTGKTDLEDIFFSILGV